MADFFKWGEIIGESGFGTSMCIMYHWLLSNSVKITLDCVITYRNSHTCAFDITLDGPPN